MKRGFDHKIIDNDLLAKPIDNLKDLFAKASNPQPWLSKSGNATTKSMF